MDETQVKVIGHEDVRVSVMKDNNQDTIGNEKENLPTKEINTFDDIFVIIGEFGRYQKLLYFMFSVTYIMTAMQLLGWVFIGAKTPVRCLLPIEVNQSQTPKYSDYAQNMSSSCSYNWNGRNISTCDLGYVYDNTNVRRTAIMEWNLVCENEGNFTFVRDLPN